MFRSKGKTAIWMLFQLEPSVEEKYFMLSWK